MSWPLSADGPRYRPTRLHAVGGLGEVHVAEDTELNRTVALKRIKADCVADAGSLHRFLREAERKRSPANTTTPTITMIIAVLASSA